MIAEPIREDPSAPVYQYQPDPEIVQMAKELKEKDDAYWAEIARNAKAAEDRNMELARLEDLL